MATWTSRSLTDSSGAVQADLRMPEQAQAMRNARLYCRCPENLRPCFLGAVEDTGGAVGTVLAFSDSSHHVWGHHLVSLSDGSGAVESAQCASFQFGVGARSKVRVLGEFFFEVHDTGFCWTH